MQAVSNVTIGHNWVVVPDDWSQLHKMKIMGRMTTFRGEGIILPKYEDKFHF